MTSAYRPGTKVPPVEFNFIYHFGGLGDYIHWTTAIQWAVFAHPHMIANVYAPAFFLELAEYWFSRWERVTVRSRAEYDALPDEEKKRLPTIVPTVQNLNTAVGSHLMDIGFRYYCNMDQIPEGWNRLPPIDQEMADVEKFNLPPRYVVVTTEATAKTRLLPAGTINEITRYVKDKGLLPVFVGKRDLKREYTSEHSDGIETDRVIDLREKTNLLECATILANADAVVGLDNGLLHLACCSDVPVIFGFTNVDPRHRIPVRYGKTVVVTPSEKLECRFCQSRMRFIPGHSFKYCIYNDYACLSALLPETFISALEEIL